MKGACRLRLPPRGAHSRVARMPSWHWIVIILFQQNSLCACLVISCLYRMDVVSNERKKNTQTLAEDKATRTLAAQPQLPAQPFGEEESFPQIAPNERTHASHEIQTLQADKDIICCTVFNALSMMLKLKSLLIPCQGLKEGNRYKLKVLMAGVATFPGARMPTAHSRALIGRGFYLHK